jgi:hypothetical protein
LKPQQEIIMVRSVAFAFALFLSTAASAQNQIGPHSATDEDACERDARRFCKDAIPDQLRVLSCLQVNRLKLSKPCQGVLQGHGM